MSLEELKAALEAFSETLINTSHVCIENKEVLETIQEGNVDFSSEKPNRPLVKFDPKAGLGKENKTYGNSILSELDEGYY